MKINVFRVISAILIMLWLTGCISQEKLSYLQDPVTEQNLYELNNPHPNHIKPNDELYIKVSSFDDLSFNFFDSQSEYSRTGFSNELSVSLISYTVNDSGYIYFPILGDLKVVDLTIEELRDKMETLLADYFNQPTVIIKFAYKKITVIGEVNNPGNYIYSKDQINLFEAIAYAGDINIHGNRNEIYLLRKVDNTVQKNRIDITSDELVFSKYYYLQPDDIIYVSPRNSVKWDVISTPISLVLSTLSTTLVVISFIMNTTNNPN